MRQIRADNNDFWMEIVKTSLRFAPGVTKALIRQIKINDARVVELWKEMADAPDDTD